MKVQVQFLPWLSGLIAGGTDEELHYQFVLAQDSTLQQFLAELAVQQPCAASVVYDPEHKVIKETAVLMLNNRAFELAGGYEAVLQDGDVLTFLAAYSGG